MTTAERRKKILEILKAADTPVPARELAARFGVSRQVIVQDIAVIRASTPGILSASRGYILQQEGSGTCSREFKVRHSEEDTEKKSGYIALLTLAKSVLETCIDLLGFEAPERM